MECIKSNEVVVLTPVLDVPRNKDLGYKMAL